MTKTLLLTILIATVFAVGTLVTNDAFATGYLKIGDIKGESTDDGHVGDIEIFSWSWGETQTASHAGGGSAGKVSMQDFNFVMEYNKASPKLMEALAKGEHFDKAELILTRNVEGPTGETQTYLTITMRDLLISSYQTGGSAGDVIPVDTISLNFGAIKFEYIPQNEDGTPEPPVIGEVSKKPGHR